MEMLGTTFFWVTLGQIIMINIVLSGDNAVVIALASRSLPPRQQRNAILFGSFGAIFLRVVLTFFAVLLLGLPVAACAHQAAPGAGAARRPGAPHLPPGPINFSQQDPSGKLAAMADYLAPELMHSGRVPDPLSDIYSLDELT